MDGRRRHEGRHVYGATDEVGLYAVENKAHVHDIHATILALLGLDHEQLTFQHNGRDERSTITEREGDQGNHRLVGRYLSSNFRGTPMSSTCSWPTYSSAPGTKNPGFAATNVHV